MKQITGATVSEIAESIESCLRRGEYPAGSTLPPVRQLAGRLAVSPATVAGAYQRLQARGLVTGDRRRGTRVCLPRGSGRLAVRAIPTQAAGVDLASGNPDPSLLPSLAAAVRSVPDLPVLYGEPAELRPFIAFARGELAADGIAVTDLLVTSGALDAIDRVLREHLRVGDRVLVEDPCYPALLDLIATSGFTPEPLALDGEGPRPDALEAALGGRPAAVILTPRAQNPTGAAISAQRASAVSAILDRHRETVLIENDPLGPVAGAPAVTLTEGRSRWAIVRSMSKVLGPDLRVALLAADPTTFARVDGRQAVGPRWVSHLLQHLALSLWSDPSSGRQLARAAAIYAQRRQALVSALAQHGIDVAAMSGFNVWIPVRHEAAVTQQLAAAGWAVAAGERFRLNSDPGIRVTTSALEPDAAQRFARDLSVVLRAAAPPPA